jgi:energy-coupling factor transporter ATP-binding protein EcfA2
VKRTLFVSYSHDNVDRDKLDYLIDQIQRRGRNSVRVLIDLQEVRLGGSFTDYMGLIESYNVDAVLIVLTPSYKQKVSKNEGNVPPEFKAIMARYEEDKQAYARLPKSDLNLYEDGRTFGIFPVLFHGSTSDSVPEALKHEALRYADISNAVAHRDRDNKPIASGASQKEMDDLAEQILVDLKNIAKQKDGDYQQRRARIRQALFANTKAGAHSSLETEVFARTTTYRRVLSQESYFIVGRKGSGKSTLTEQLELQNPNKYANHVAIDFSRVKLAFIYSFYTNPQFQSDAGATRGYRAEYLELVWECFFIFCLVWRKRDNEYFLSWLRTEFGEEVDEYSPEEFFDVALGRSIERFAKFQDATISALKETLSSLPASLSVRRFIEHVFGKQLVKAVQALSSEGTTLITLDGIDTAFHDYRLEYMRFGVSDTEDYYQGRARVELDLVKALMRLVANIKAKPRDFPVLTACEFCVTIPLDLFQEIKQHHERDSYRLLASCRSLDWSGLELAVMLRKRLEKLNEIQVNRERFYSPRERLLELLDECYPGLPKEIPIEVGGRRIAFPIFIYVLRHTFWRPREVIFHFVGLISSFVYFRGSTPITESDVKAIVKEQAKALVKSEFIDEFKSTISNIDEIIEHLRGGPQYYPYDRFMAILESIEFNFYLNLYGKEQSAAISKLRLLYEIGFLGIRLTDTQMLRHSRPRNVFSFSEGIVIFDELRKEGFDGAAVCINPAFIEYLNIQIDPNQEIALNVDWEYLRENEVRRNAAAQW